MRLRRMMVSVLAFLMVATLLPASASASEFRLRVEDLNSGLGVVITDWNRSIDPDPVSPPGDLNPDGGLISVQIFMLGSIQISLTTGQTKPAGPVTGSVAEMFLTSVSLMVSGPASLRLTLEDHDYELAGPMTLQVNTKVTGLASDGGFDIASQSWADPGNAVPNLGPELTAVGDVGDPLDPTAFPGFGTGVIALNETSVGSGGVFGVASSDSFDDSGLFSVYTSVVLNIDGIPEGFQTLSFNTETTVDQTSEAPVPEPGSLLLIATGVAGLASRLRRRKSTNV